jgi:hypothetical protein
MRLDEYLQDQLGKMPPDKRAEFEAEAAQLRDSRLWAPNPGPQTEAYFCEADETLYAGEAGGGKSDLGLGLALTQHKRSLLLRRINADAAALGDRLIEIVGSSEGYNSGTHRYRGRDGRLIEIAGCEQEKDKQRFKGRPHDLKFFDELADFLESQYLFIIGWTRSAESGQRCRVVAASNPPTTPEGQWIIKRWRPWLDATHPKPAKSGELRWFLSVNGEDVEVDGPGPHVIEGRRNPVRATSRTFIRCTLSDNPDLDEGGQYEARLEAMPEMLRRAYREGDFTVGSHDHEWQLIPTAWIVAAQGRWKPDGNAGLVMTAMGYDPAGGGQASAELARRYGAWYDEMLSAKGPETADAPQEGARIVRYRRGNCPVVVDVGGGYGSGVKVVLEQNGITPVAFNGSAGASRRAQGTDLPFANKRSQDWWLMREELDPGQDGGSQVALPPDPELRADLAAPRWSIKLGVIHVEPKVVIGSDGKVTGGIMKRLGRSPGKGDAVVMALAEGDRAAAKAARAFAGGLQNGQFPKVNLGRRSAARRR